MKTKDGFVLREMCGENIITGEGLEHINFNKLISLNSTAAFLWNAVAGKEFTPESMAQLLVDEYIQFYNYERIDMKNGLTPFEIRSKAA